MPRRNPPQRLSSYPHGRRLRVEPLEDRRMLATFVVDLLEDNTEDDGMTTLREAIAAANATAEADVIEFAAELFAEGPRTLTLLEVGDTALAGSALTIATPMTIVGPGAELLTLDASALDATPDAADGMGVRLLQIDDSNASVQFDVTLSGMALTGGDTAHSGGAIYSRENLTLTQIVLTENHAHRHATEFSLGAGGGLYQSGGQLAVHNSRIVNNSAGTYGGGIYTSADVAEIHDSLIEHNHAYSKGGGIYSNREQLRVVGSAVKWNIAAGATHGNGDTGGGGIYHFDGSLTIAATEVDFNVAGSEGSVGHGGGVYTIRTTLDITDSTFNGNRSNGSGGGLHINQPRGDFTRNGVSANTAAEDGGGLYLSYTTDTSLDFASNSIVRNTASNGGGLAITSRYTVHPRFTDSIISTNTALASGGGIHIHATTPVTIERSTIANNLADADGTGSGIGDGIMLEAGDLTLSGSIVAGNGRFYFTVPVAPDLGRTFGTSVTLAHSLIGSNAGNGLVEAPLGSPDANGNLIGGDYYHTINARLAPLAFYGGSIETQPPLAISPAIDGGDPAAVGGDAGVPAFDVRGEPYTRVWSPEGEEPARIDMGSTEFQPYAGGTSLLVDTLEDEFDSNISAGDLSLREAVAIANGHTRTFEISFAPELFGGTIHLELGEILIASELAIVGPGADLLTILGYEERPEFTSLEQVRRLFRVDDGSADSYVEVALEGVTLSGGFAPADRGGAISSVERLTLRGIRAVNNYADGGGAVFSGAGQLRIESSQFLHNTSYDPLAFRNDDGGAIHTLDTDLYIADSQFQNNEAAMGGAIFAATLTTPGGSREVEITGSRFEDNDALGNGGGLAVRGMMANIANSLFERNTMRALTSSLPEDGGGAIYTIGSSLTLSGSYLFNNGSSLPGGFGDGGGVLAAGVGDRFYPAVENPILVVTDTRFRSNSVSGDGGALFTIGMQSVLIEKATFEFNQAHDGGAAYVFAKSVDIDASVFQLNTSIIDGGALYFPRAPLGFPNVTATISHSTFEGNSAGSDGGALFVQGAMITHSTFSENIATGGAGGAVHFDNPGPTADRIAHSSFIANRANTSPAIHRGNNRIITHTVIADNVNHNGDLVAPMFFTSLTLRHSFIDYKPTGNPYPETGLSSPDSNGNFIGGPAGGPLDPMLGPLQYNGGPTPTHRPLPGSPLIDAGDPAFNPSDPDGDPNTDDAVLYDQRGEPFARVKDGVNPRDVVIDIGAVEYDPTLTPGDFNGDRVVDSRDYLVWRNSLGMEVTPLAGADASGNGAVDTLDYLVWKDHFGEVYPELPEEPQLPEESELAGAGATLLAVPTGLPVDRRMPPTRRGEVVDRSRVREAEDSDSQLLLVVDRVANQPDLQRASGADDRLVERATRTVDGEPLAAEIAARQLAFDELAG